MAFTAKAAITSIKVTADSIVFDVFPGGQQAYARLLGRYDIEVTVRNDGADGDIFYEAFMDVDRVASGSFLIPAGESRTFSVWKNLVKAEGVSWTINVGH